jgi:penicillin amidase
MRRVFRLLFRLALASLVLAVIAAGAGWYALRASLPQLEGELALSGLSGPARIERDALGTVTIHAANEVDVARVLGWVHGQERFFEMDLLRRAAAGELSALFGPMAIERDKEIRVHRLRARVNAHLAQIAGDRLPLMQAYADGVNAGRDALGARPWPYLLLRAEPEAWKPADTALAGYAMFFDLQDESNSRELALWKIRQTVPPALYALIAADGTGWDAPLVGEPRGNVALPGADVLDLRKLPALDDVGAPIQSEEAAPGSNNFAVGGTLTADGRAIVADDMHLTLRAPNLWFRARLVYPDPKAPGGQVDVAGFTLPGIPAVIVGSNTHVAWAFTNSYGDWADFIRVPACEPRCTQTVVETIQVKGGDPVSFPVEVYGWDESPVTAHDVDGSPLALAWIAHKPRSLDLGLVSLARAADLESALRIGQDSGMPQQNLVVGDAAGHIGWTITGRRPTRDPVCDPKAPVPGDPSPAAPPALPAPAPPPRVGDDPFAVLIAPVAPPVAGNDSPACLAFSRFDDHPAPLLASPVVDRLWTANNRTLEGAALARIGDAGYANGARARQIRDGLRAKDRFTEADLLAIQVDDRALFLEHWWQALRAQAKARPEVPAWKVLGAATQAWEGRAAPDAVAYRLVRAWRLAVIDKVRAGLTAPAAAALGDDFVMPDLPQIEGVAWQLVQQRPAHLLPRRYASWDALLDEAAADVVAEIEGQPGGIAKRTWGERNTAAICHPLARALPGFLATRLCMPADPLAGDGNMPRVIGPDFGASERMVVSPGHEADGIVHMPGGQSGHPLSPYWGAGHAAWVKGEATPFLPGATEHTIEVR